MADDLLTESFAAKTPRRQRHPLRSLLDDVAIDDAQTHAGPDDPTVSTIHRGTADPLGSALGDDLVAMQAGKEEPPQTQQHAGARGQPDTTLTLTANEAAAAPMAPTGSGGGVPAIAIATGAAALPRGSGHAFGPAPRGSAGASEATDAAAGGHGGDGLLAAITRAFTPGVQKIAKALGIASPGATSPALEPTAEAESLKAAFTMDAMEAATTRDGETGVGVPNGGVGRDADQGAAHGQDTGVAGNVEDPAVAEIEALIDTIDDILSVDTGDQATGAESTLPSEALDDIVGGALEDGDITLSGSAGNDTLDGGAGTDVLKGGAGDDSLLGGDGGDRLSGGAGGDVLDGGLGEDVLKGGDGADSLLGGGGADQLSGGTGDDLLDGGMDDDVLSGGAADDVLMGGEGSDRLSGGADGDTLDGGIGEDVLKGGDGADSLLGGGGADQLSGGTGDDLLDGGMDDDVLSGGAADDVLIGGTGDDRLTGGDGADTFRFGPEFGNDVIRDFSAAEGDRIDLSGAGIADFAELLDNAESTRRGTVLHTDAGTLTLRGVDADDLASDQFIFAEPVGDAQEAAEQAAAAPTGIATARFEVDEGTAGGTAVGSAAIDNAGAGESYTYSLADDAEGRFAIDAITGAITVSDGAALDHESAARRDITVEATDSTGNTQSAPMPIGVNDRNESTDTFHGEVMANGPVGYWRLGEGGGWNLPAADETGTASGTWHNTATGDRDGAFAGISAVTTYLRRDEYVTIPDHPAWQLTDGTVQFWMKADDTRDRQGLISRDAEGDGEGHFSVTLERNDIDVRIGGQDGGTLSANNVITDHGWHQIAVTFGADGLEIWVDGVMVANDPAITQGIAGSHEDWVIGADHRSSGAGTTDDLDNFFDGRIAEVAIFDTQLGPNAIGDLYDAGVNGTDVMRLTDDSDLFAGTADADMVEAGASDDVISGGDDFLFGGDGDDVLSGGAGGDVLSGGLGSDTVDYSASDAAVAVDLGAMTASGGHAEGDSFSGIENVTGSLRDDMLTGDAGDNLFAGLAGNDSIDGGAGGDTFMFGEAGGMDTVKGGTGGGWTDSIMLQNDDASAIGGGWTITLTRGTVEADDGASLTLSQDAAGTITLADGSEIAFDGMERIDYGS